jgi:hypothetical protein
MGQAVLVTTSHRGVFFGYTDDTPEGIVEKRTVRLTRGRNVVYWPAENQGFMGLVAMGPQRGARVGPPADIALNDITSCAICPAETLALWEDAPWSR